MKTHHFLIFLFSISIANAGTVNFSNFTSGLEVQSDGTPINGGFVAVGTTADPNSYTDPDLLESSFIQFGDSSSFGGAAAFNLDGFFSGVAVGDGGSQEFSGKRIFLIGGEGSSISDSENLFLIDTGADFAADSPIFAATVDLDSGTILMGDLSGQAVVSGAAGALQPRLDHRRHLLAQAGAAQAAGARPRDVGALHRPGEGLRPRAARGRGERRMRTQREVSGTEG
mgnify:CR=1 FL=1